MKKSFFFYVLLLFGIGIPNGQAQIVTVISGSEFNIKAGTLIDAEGLDLIPSTDFSITSSLSLSNTLSNSASISSINRTYNFESTSAPYSGDLKINYQNSELNSLVESDLKMFHHNGSTWTIDNSSTNDPTANYVSTSFSAKTVNELSLVEACSEFSWASTSVSTDWNTTNNWSCYTLPDLSSNVVINQGAIQPVLTSDVAINSLTLNTGTSLTVSSGYDLTVTNSIHNSGMLTVQNNANLIQVDNVANTGNIIVNRNSAPIVRLDHTLWSSPVTGTQSLQQFSPNTLSNRFYNYSTSSNSYTAIPANSTFEAGKGFAVRAPNNQTATTPTIWPGAFTGIPNNGTISFTLNTIGSGYNLVGNPYPSALSAATFVAANSSITGTLYFYAHSLSMNANGLFPAGSTNYTSRNGTGTTAATHIDGDVHLTPELPNGIIQVGQGFLVKANNTGATLNFTNAMRVGSNENQFFRTNTIEKHRMWLNLKTGAGIEINQILVGYITDATQAEDRDFDGLSFGNTGSFLSSKIASNDYVIQGRSLPFDSNDIVPLGFTADSAGTYSIALTNSDGIFADTQDVFLKDDLTGITHDIKASAYDFASNSGTFDARFSLIYTNTLANNSTSFTSNSVVVFKPNQWFTINTNGTIMKDVLVFDMAGRLIFQQSDINANMTVLKGLSPTNEVLLVKIVSNENEVVTVKVSN